MGEVFNIVFSGIMEVAWISLDISSFLSQNIQFDSALIIFTMSVFSWLTFFKHFIINRLDLKLDLGGFEGSASDYLCDIILSYVVALITYKAVPVLMVFSDQNSEYYILNLFNKLIDNGSFLPGILTVITLIVFVVFAIIPGMVSSLKFLILGAVYICFANVIEKVIHYPDSASFPLSLFAPVLLWTVSFLLGFILDTAATRFIEWVISLARGSYTGKKENSFWYRFCDTLKMMI